MKRPDERRSLMNSPELASKQRYTVADYVAWNDGRRYELLHGGVHAMSPAPSWQHQVISGNLEFEIKSSLRPKKICQIVYRHPTSVVTPLTGFQTLSGVCCDTNHLGYL